MMLPSAPLLLPRRLDFPARAERFGGLVPPVDAVERTPVFRLGAWPVTASRFVMLVTLPGAGAR